MVNCIAPLQNCDACGIQYASNAALPNTLSAQNMVGSNAVPNPIPPHYSFNYAR